MMPDPVRLFHITAIENLKAICKAGKLICKNEGATQGSHYQNIAHSGAQGARSIKSVPNPPGGNIHDFVPFYFAPRSPMLSAIHNGRVEGCVLKQSDIIHFETTVPRVLAHETNIVFYDRNATLRFSVAHTDTNLLATEIAWDLLTESPELDGFCKYFQNRPSVDGYVDRMERRLAEFLVKTSIPIECITRIGVTDEAVAEKVRAILTETSVKLEVEVMRDWYFMGQ